MQFVYGFDHDHGRPPMGLTDLLGGKGANLAEMASVLGLPVPPGFTITTEACRAYLDADTWPEGLDGQVSAAVRTLEASVGRSIGGAADPLLVSVRSGARRSMPGMMDTVLDLGLNDDSVLGLAAVTGDRRFAFDSYRRFVQMFAEVVLDVPDDEVDDVIDAACRGAGVASESELDADQLSVLTDDLKAVVQAHTGEAFPQDPAVQLRLAIDAVFRSWNAPRARAYRERERIDHRLGTAVNVQMMVFGNRDEQSGTGVGFTRDPATGRAGVYGDFLVQAQGEDVVAGTHRTRPLSELQDHFPDVYAELVEIFRQLETHYRDMLDTEFTIEQGHLWMLQTRVGKRSGAAAVRCAVAMVDDEHIRLSRAEAIGRVTAEHLDQILHPQLGAVDPERVLTTGLGASPGAAVGRVYTTADDAVAAHERGEQVVLVRTETSPDDIHGMQAAEGVLTARGGLVSHAAVVARGWGKPAVVGAEAVQVAADHVTVGDRRIEVGDVISIDGTSGEVILGEVALAEASVPDELDVLLTWADEIRGSTLAVRANADNGQDAAEARRRGAQGIGLCRTEHMFFGDRLPVVQRMILATDPDEEAAALDDLRRVQTEDFIAVLEAMDGLPVTVRLLDPPLHEFLPDREDLVRRDALGTLDDEGRALLAATAAWREVNPMLGTRGVRLGIIKHGLYRMQVRALLDAAISRVDAGGTPIVEIMVPLVVGRPEVDAVRAWVDDEIAAARQRAGHALAVHVGTMIETPRAALVAGEIAESAEFFSFGTNDLTQMTFGFSRDDVEAKVMPTYLRRGLLSVDPFDTIDVAAVGELVSLATSRGRATRPGLPIGVCGEHGGDPASIAFFVDVGVDYVSCSPFRVPVARLAGAQAVLARDRTEAAQ